MLKVAYECSYFSEEIIMNSAADTDDGGLSLENLLDITDHLCAPRPAAVLHKREKLHVNVYTGATQCSVAAAAAAAEVSPVRHSASCPRGEGSARLSVGPSAVPDHSARCSSRLWPVGRLKCVRYDLKEGQELSRGSATHIVRKDICDSHKDGVFGGHGGQMQPELQITHRVTAEVLQLRTQTT